MAWKKSCFSHCVHKKSQLYIIFCMCNNYKGIYTQNYSTKLVIILHRWLIRMWWYTTECLNFSVFNLKQQGNGPQKQAFIHRLVFQWNIQIFWNTRIKVAWGTLRCSPLRNILQCYLQWDKQVLIFPRDFALFSSEKRQWLMITARVPCIAERVPQAPHTLSSIQAELWRHIISFMSFPMKHSVSQYLNA